MGAGLYGASDGDKGRRDLEESDVDQSDSSDCPQDAEDDGYRFALRLPVQRVAQYRTQYGVEGDAECEQRRKSHQCGVLRGMGMPEGKPGDQPGFQEDDAEYAADESEYDNQQYAADD